MDPALILKVEGKSGKSSLFMKLTDLFPECIHLIRDAAQLYPLFCLRNNMCPRNQNCMGKLVKRVKYIFDHFPDGEVLFLYFTYPDRPGTHRAGVFNKDLSEPYYTTFNRTAWDKFKQVGVIYEWFLPDSLFLG